MKFGERLRQLRNDKDLTQPELAEAMGIEQSYLSKLENDKSLPSNDVLNRILDVFDIEVGDLVNDLDQGTRNQLRQIPDVADHFNRQKQLLIGNRQRWLLVSALLLSFGISLIYAGNVHLFFSDIVYQYKSHGVVFDGESKEIFLDPVQFISKGGAERGAIIEFLDSINARVDEVYLQNSEFHGNIFNVEVDGGSRTYYLNRETEVDPWQSKLVVFAGVLMTIFGLIGIFLERKLSRYQ
jgi:transcriptional regulator with XRE-family HTH domain